MIEKLSGCPMLHCTDVYRLMRDEFLGQEFEPRFFAHKWSLCSRLDEVLDLYLTPGTMRTSQISSEWQFFSRIYVLATKLYDTAKQIKFDVDADTQPFSVLKLDPFNFTLPRLRVFSDVDIESNDDYKDVNPEMEEEDDWIAFSEFEVYVDDAVVVSNPYDDTSTATTAGSKCVAERPPCNLHDEYAEPRRDVSPFCYLHHRAAVRPYDAFRKQFPGYSPSHRHTDLDRLRAYQHSAVFRRPLPTRMSSLRQLLGLRTDLVLWTIDTEFCSIKNANAVVFSICKRDLSTKRIILFTNVDYDMSLAEVQAALYAQQDKYSDADHRPRGCSSSSSSFQRFYHGDRTNDLSLSAIGEATRRAPFSPQTHKVLSLYCSVDIAIFHRELLGDSALISRDPSKNLTSLLDPTSGEVCLQPVNIAIVLRDCTNLASVKLGYAYRPFFSDFLVTCFADNNTLVMCHLYDELVREGRAWV